MFLKVKQGNIKHHYHFDRRIGEGSIGMVYEARNRVTLEKVAIKSIVNIDLDLHKKFINECCLLKKLDHPNITKIIDIWQWDKLLFLVMNFNEGGKLQRCLEQRQTGYLEEYEVYKLMH